MACADDAKAKATATNVNLIIGFFSLCVIKMRHFTTP
jgi:hypothetical protein